MDKLSDMPDEVIADFKEVVADLENLLKATANQSGDKLAEARAKAEKSLKVAKANMAYTQDVLLIKAKAAAKVTDAYVHDNPWRVIGAAAGISLLIGLLIGRR